MNAVSGTRRAIKELVDGTIRVQVDIDPRFRKVFFELFPDIDAPIALAPLSMGFETTPPADEKGSGSHDQAPASTPAPPKAGKAPQRLSNYAAQLCRTADFHRFMAARNPDLWRMDLRICDEDPEATAAHEIRLWCNVATRADLDVPANTSAIESFHVLREEYANWLKERVE